MQKILVTGGAGFIGSHTVDLLTGAGYEVLVLDNLSSGSPDNLPKQENVQLIEADITSQRAVEEVFGRHADLEAVIHLAAQSKVGFSLEYPLEDAAINIDGTINLLEQSREHGIRQFIYASSAAVYGAVEELPVTENSPKSPLSPYGISKLAAEEYVQAYGRLYPLTTTALRFANVFGPRQSTATEAGVITIFIEQMLRGEKPVIFGDGRQTRDFVFVRDVARAIVSCLSQTESGRIFNVSTGTETSILTMLEQINQVLGRHIGPRFAAERPGDIRYSYLDNGKIQKALNWEPETSLTAGVAETVRYFQG